MTTGWLIFVIGSIFSLYVAVKLDTNWPLIGILVAPVIGISSCTDSQEWKDRKTLEAAREAAYAQPFITKEVDGCKVYAFKQGGLWHYFTRCPDSQVTTDTTITERHGKSTTTRVESIKTEER